MKYVNAGNGKMPLITLIAILSISLTINMPGLAVSPMLGKLRDIFHSSEMEAQLVTSLPNLFMIPIVLIAGKISTPSRQTAVLMTGLITFLVGGIGCFFATSMVALIVLGCLVGVGCGLVVPIAAGYISEWFMGKSRQADLGLKSTTSNAMVIVANIYVGIVAAHYWHAAFVVYLTPLIPLALIPFMTQKYVNKHRILNTAEDETHAAAISGNSEAKAPYHFQGSTSTWMLVSLICLYMFLTYATTSISYYAPFCMEHFGMSTTEVGIVTAMYYLMCAVCGAIVTPLKKIFGKNTLFISLALCAAGLFGIGFTHNFWVYFFSSLITGFGYGIIQPIIYNKTTYVAPNRKLGTQYFGYVLSANYVSIMMVPFVDSAARKIFHSTLPTFEFIFSGAVVVVLLIWALIKHKNYVFAINPASAAPTPEEIAAVTAK
ncbi:MAG: MFS transporter [Muribaculaceae bacterium]|nr:MFS transporter [Muribaculaceae bacterium]